MRNQGVTLRNSTSFIHTSKYVDDDFKISVALPRAYDCCKSYPVLYVLDANIFFALASDTVRLLEFGKEIPDLIVVGIGYEVEEEHMRLRNRDYLPTSHPDSQGSGGAENFINYLSLELMPLINSKYKTNKKDNTLFGDSYSGLFAVYNLLNQGDLFNRYIIGSPSLYWDDCVIFKEEEKHFRSNASIEATVFLSVGALEAVLEPEFAKMVSNVEALNERLLSRKYPLLNLKTHVFDNETHLSVIPATISRGLREVFK